MVLSDKRRILGFFALAMINVAAITSLRNISIIVEYGFACVFYYLLAALLFFIPTALICAELATGWPKSGGVYRWVSDAFGEATGFVAIWFAWMLSVAWFPTVLVFTASALAYIVQPELINHSGYMIGVTLSIFWAATLINFAGMKTSSWISSMGVILGTLIPGVFIIALGMIWWGLGKDLQISMTFETAIPKLELNSMVFFAGVILSLAGMEMSAFHAREARHPKKTYPISIFISAVIILVIYILGSLSIAFVVPAQNVSLFAGLMQAFTEFFNAFNLKWMMPILAFLAFVGSLAGINTWIIGPAKGILASAQHGFLPPWMQTVNKHGAPVGTLLVQAVLVSALSLVFYFMPNINTAFWIITALTTQFAMVMYLLIFLSGIRLRYKYPHVERSYRVPGGNIGMWLIAGVGAVTSIFAFFICFVPPSKLDIGSLVRYEGFIFVGLILLSLPPLFFILFKKPHWKKLMAEHLVSD